MTVDTALGHITDRFARLAAFAVERHRIYLRRAAGDPYPWTSDPILREWRFCNVYRELDAVTTWIRTEWRVPHGSDPDLWFAMCVARFVNWPPTLGQLGFPVPWSAQKFIRTMQARRAAGEQSYSGAYMIPALPGRPGMRKEEYLAEYVLNPLWARRAELRPVGIDTLERYHDLLSQEYSFGSFMAGQVVADIKYAPTLCAAKDWWTFAASGPGSRRGLNRVLGYPVNQPWKEAVWRLGNEVVREKINERFRREGFEPIHGQDAQNCLCEYDKMERVRLGEGQPKMRFRHT
jgi:hypothetical protein